MTMVTNFGFIPAGAYVAPTAANPALSVTIPDYASGMLISAHGGIVRFTVDGTTTATGSIGFPIANNSYVELNMIPGTVVSLFSTANNVSYQFVKRIDSDSLGAR